MGSEMCIRDSSTGTRESLHAMTAAIGSCPPRISSRRRGSRFGVVVVSVAKRWLPARSSSHTSLALLVVGMPYIVADTVANTVINPPEIIAWYRAHARALPWREPGTSAWGVLLSEVMSHQTQVERVAPIWQEWVERWPTPAAFAAAGTDEVLRAWGSLGYPRRALRLKECAQAIVDAHGGVVPDSVDCLLYTSDAADE